jgi:hypothetical protein
MKSLSALCLLLVIGTSSSFAAEKRAPLPRTEEHVTGKLENVVGKGDPGKEGFEAFRVRAYVESGGKHVSFVVPKAQRHEAGAAAKGSAVSFTGMCRVLKSDATRVSCAKIADLRFASDDRPSVKK